MLNSFLLKLQYFIILKLRKRITIYRDFSIHTLMNTDSLDIEIYPIYQLYISSHFKYHKIMQSYCCDKSIQDELGNCYLKT